MHVPSCPGRCSTCIKCKEYTCNTQSKTAPAVFYRLNRHLFSGLIYTFKSTVNFLIQFKEASILRNFVSFTLIQDKHFYFFLPCIGYDCFYFKLHFIRWEFLILTIYIEYIMHRTGIKQTSVKYS